MTLTPEQQFVWGVIQARGQRIAELEAERDLALSAKAADDDYNTLMTKVERYRKALLPFTLLTCDCDDAYTIRGRHEPNTFHSDYEVEIAAARAALDGAEED